MSVRTFLPPLGFPAPHPDAAAHKRPRRSATLTRALAVLACLGLAATASSAAPAVAQTKDDLAKAEAKALEAKFKFKAGAFGEAAELFLHAYTISKRSALLYNAARAFEEAKRFKEARAAYKEYLTLADVGDDGKAEARKRIEQLEREIAAAEASAAARPSPTAPSAGEGAGSGAAAGSSSSAGTTAQGGPAPGSGAGPSQGPAAAPAAAAPGSGAKAAATGVAASTPAAPQGPNKIVTWSLLGGGGLLAILGAAAISGAITKANGANDMDFSVDDAKVKYGEQFDAARGTLQSGYVLVGVGLGLAGWGAWRLLQSPKPAAAAQAAYGAPAWLSTGAGAGVAGVVLGGRF